MNNLEQYKLDALLGEEVRIYLSNGVPLRGRLEAHDEDSIFLVRPAEGGTLVYKYHVTTIAKDDPTNEYTKNKTRSRFR